MTPDYLQHAMVSTARKRALLRSSASVKPLTPGTVLWALTDFAFALIAGLIALKIRGRNAPVPHDALLLSLTHSAAPVSLAYVVVFGLYLVLCLRFFGLYAPSQNRSGLNEMRLTSQAAFTAALLLCGTLYLRQGYAVSRIVVCLTMLIAMLMLMASRGAWRVYMRRRYLEGLENRNVLIVGTGRVAHALRNHLEALRHMGFRFKGFIAVDQTIGHSSEADLVGDLASCVAVARSLFVDEIYVSTPAEKNAIVKLVEEARVAGVDVRVVPDLYDGLAWNAPVEFIGQFPTIPLHMRDFPIGAFLLKRVMDIVLSSMALLALAPFMIAIAIGVKVSSPGPVLYCAQRMGRRGRMFTCFKFRTMVEDADARREDLLHRNERDGVLFKIDDDPRITAVGRRLRRYSLDELPQFFNVFVGNMSLVGPRPPLASEVAQYETEHMRRLDVLPGMTGLWQVEARQDPSFDSYISLDTAYVENWNLMLDLRILARTIGVVLAGTGS